MQYACACMCSWPSACVHVSSLACIIIVYANCIIVYSVAGVLKAKRKRTNGQWEENLGELNCSASKFLMIPQAQCKVHTPTLQALGLTSKYLLFIHLRVVGIYFWVLTINISAFCLNIFEVLTIIIYAFCLNIFEVLTIIIYACVACSKQEQGRGRAFGGAG